MSVAIHKSMCQLCYVCCPITVDTDGREVRSVKGDRDNPITGGYACIKGRSQAALYSHPDRLLTSLRRRADGTFQQVSATSAMDEIAERLSRIVDRDGPRAVASYLGTMGSQKKPCPPFLNAFMGALGSPMTFSSSSIDKPGKFIARSALGRWSAPFQGYADPNMGILVGLNPFVSYQGLPHTNPAKWLNENRPRGFKLVVIDPRANDAARRADLHLQVRPGFDVEILAALVRVVIDEDLFDTDFVSDNVSGFSTLAAAVRRFDVRQVAERAGVDAADIVATARQFAAAGRGYVWCGTGPNFTASGTLVEYLGLCLMVLCGYVMREGDVVPNPGTSVPTLAPKAQAQSPRETLRFGEQTRIRNLSNTAAGMPTSALPDEILLEGPGQVRALISVGGNPAVAWPDQMRTLDALRSLELLVQIDPWMSETAKLADYVIAPPFGLEVAGIPIAADHDIDYNLGYGRAESWGQYTPAILDRPEGSDLIEEWEFFHGIGRRLGLDLVLTPRPGGPSVAVDMDEVHSTEDVLEMITTGARIPFEELKRHPGGSTFPGEPVVVAPKDPGWSGRLDVGNAELIADLLRQAGDGTPTTDGRWDLRLVPRRVTNVYNSSYNISPANRGRPYNPLFMHPADLASRDLEPGSMVRIQSEAGTIVAIVESDETMRPGVISMSHCFGGTPEDDDRYLELGSPTSRLLTLDQTFDEYSGQPLMTNVPVQVVPMETPGDGS